MLINRMTVLELSTYVLVIYIVIVVNFNYHISPPVSSPCLKAPPQISPPFVSTFTICLVFILITFGKIKLLI